MFISDIVFVMMRLASDIPDQAKEENFFFEDKTSFPIKNGYSNYSEKHQCNTCKQEIGSEISRIVMMQNKDGGPSLFFFHFFFPCWDFNLICQKHPNLIIERAGFSIPENIVLKESTITEMEKNLDLWV